VTTLKVNVVVACTDRKTARPAPELQLRHYREGTTEERLFRWVTALRDSESPPITVAQLYAGDHWYVARNIPATAPAHVEATIWVSSAGYGLLSLDQRIRPYSATFSSRHADSVTVRSTHGTWDEVQTWWAGLASNRKRLLGDSHPLTVTELAELHPTTPLLVAAAPQYIRAMAADLRLTRGRLKDPELLSIFSAGTRQLRELSSHLIPLHGGFQARVDGTAPPYLKGCYPSLNVRVAALAIQTAEESELRASALREHFTNIARALPPPRLFSRRRVSLADVESFIRGRLAENPYLKHSPLLREFRESGRALEQGKFKEIVARLRAESATTETADPARLR
jgi:hypothetical protein